LISSETAEAGSVGEETAFVTPPGTGAAVAAGAGFAEEAGTGGALTVGVGAGLQDGKKAAVRMAAEKSKKRFEFVIGLRKDIELAEMFVKCERKNRGTHEFF
jgi:hypothetical protein